MAERFMGAACLLMGASGITVEVQSPHKWITHDGGGISIGLGCIGGGIEEGETPIEALHCGTMAWWPGRMRRPL